MDGSGGLVVLVMLVSLVLLTACCSDDSECKSVLFCCSGVSEDRESLRVSSKAIWFASTHPNRETNGGLVNYGLLA